MATLAAEPSAASLPRGQVLVAFSGLLLAMLLASLDQTIVATALPTIVGELGGLERLSWVVTAYLLAQTVVTPLYGKLGDLYGRKGVLQGAVVLFLVGSVLCGLSRSMGQLIGFRFLQGLGGGGLMVTTMAVVGDIIPPRERGRYQGIFGAVFGLSSVAGPLLGGYFTTAWSWRWIFYINLPLGIVALIVIAATLPSAGTRQRRRIDYAGAVLLAVALSAIILVTDLGGSVFGWSSPIVLGLAALGAVSLIAFALVERRAEEPVLPPHLFRNRTFAITSAIALVVGFAMFGSVTYLPLFLQVVKGASPTGSGLQMVSLMAGMLATSILSGQLISRTGRYKLFPIAGTALMVTALLLLSFVTAETSDAALVGMMLLLGCGIGLIMQVLVIAVQNAVDYRDLGTATSGNTLFRSIGGSVGTAILGVIFAVRLGAELRRVLPGTAGLAPSEIAKLPPALHRIYAQAFTEATGTIFAVAGGLAVMAFLLTWLLPEKPLRETIAATSAEVGQEMGGAVAMPAAPEPYEELVRGLVAVVDRDLRRKHFERIVARAGVALDPAAAWLLVRLGEQPETTLDALARQSPFGAEALRRAAEDLRAKGWIAGDMGLGRVTQAGCAIFEKIVVARRAHLTEVFSQWTPGEQKDLAGLLRRLVPDMASGEPG
ncbi:MAG TPA: MDR family MFS transporter [Thermoanaerobaculia bacterium]|jgi:EmrB/QacA subfamily drug resistance transporter|nr:MDR family MFS transporter [Thermoanaerobaculia bacterium]